VVRASRTPSATTWATHRPPIVLTRPSQPLEKPALAGFFLHPAATRTLPKVQFPCQSPSAQKRGALVICSPGRTEKMQP